MGIRKFLNEVLKLLLPVVFIGYISCTSFFTHVHVVNGVAVVHSHPFQKKIPGTPFHSHTRAAFQVIHLLTSFNLTADVVPHFSFGNHFPEYIDRANSLFRSVFLPLVAGVLSLRAPPFVFSYR